MPLWRCPHCATPQPEAARCWVCRRSTTSCATCRHFRRGVTAGLGFCGLDRQRLPLRGDEMRACWAAADEGAEIEDAVHSIPGGQPNGTAVFPGGGGGRPGRTFVPVEEVRAASASSPATAGRGAVNARPAKAQAVSARSGEIAGRWSLWGDLEP